jgi:hypothetical protein
LTLVRERGSLMRKLLAHPREVLTVIGAEIPRQHGRVFQAFVLIMVALLIVSGYTAVSAVVKAGLFDGTLRGLPGTCSTR